MTVEQRKIELINWITNLKNENLLDRMEELKIDESKDIPAEILSLLELSSNADDSELIEHTSVRDLLK
jgi:hypothetical protein